MGTTARMPISSPRTTICQGYSKIPAPPTVAWPKRQKSGAFGDSRSKAQKVPVTMRDHMRQVTQNAITASSQQRCTLLWL